MDELLKIRTFIDVVENGSFSAAARQQDVSISSIARRVAALEEDLGVRLLNRNTRNLSVTEAGQLYYEQSREAVRGLDAARVEATSFQEDIKGELRVSLRISVAKFILPQLGRFLDDNPGLSIDFSMTDERLDLLKNNIDVAVWVGPLDDSELIARQLSSGKRLLCASPKYLAEHGTPARPADLANHQCLTFHASSYGRKWFFAKDGETTATEVDGPFRSSSGLALMTAALSGMGLVVLQTYMVRDELNAGTLMPVMTDYEVSPTEADSSINVVYSHSRLLAPKARAFVDFLVACFRDVEKQPANAATTDPATLPG